jgi:hypothetical protein
MEVDFNRPFVRVGGTGGRSSTPSYDCGGFPARPQSSYDTVFGASSVLPLAGRSRPGGPQGIPPQGGAAAPVDEAPAGPRYDGSHADMRGAVPTYRAGVGLGRVRGSLAT